MILLCVPFISVGFFIFGPFLVRATSMVETERIHRQASTPEVHRNKLNELSERSGSSSQNHGSFIDLNLEEIGRLDIRPPFQNPLSKTSFLFSPRGVI